MIDKIVNNPKPKKEEIKKEERSKTIPVTWDILHLNSIETWGGKEIREAGRKEKILLWKIPSKEL